MAARGLVGTLSGLSTIAASCGLVAPAYSGNGVARSVAYLNMGPTHRRLAMSRLPGMVDCSIYMVVSGGSEVRDQSE